MKFITSLILTALLSFVACLYLPWWSIAIAAFIIAVVIKQRPGLSFISGFVALFLLWACVSFYISANNEHLLAHRLSLIILKIDSPFALIMITASVGAIVAAFAALAGSYLRKSKPVA
jgi:cbb3-type cytochrome oxidase subunit 1